MFKKLGIFIVVCILFLYIYGYIYNYMRLKEIIPQVVGENNTQYIDKIDDKLEIGGPISKETYIFKILDNSKINCKQLNTQVSKDEVPEFEGKYINQDKVFCTKSISDEYNRTIQLLIQEDILILNIFVD